MSKQRKHNSVFLYAGRYSTANAQAIGAIGKANYLQLTGHRYHNFIASCAS